MHKTASKTVYLQHSHHYEYLKILPLHVDAFQAPALYCFIETLEKNCMKNSKCVCVGDFFYPFKKYCYNHPDTRRSECMCVQNAAQLDYIP